MLHITFLFQIPYNFNVLRHDFLNMAVYNRITIVSRQRTGNTSDTTRKRPEHSLLTFVNFGEVCKQFFSVNFAFFPIFSTMTPRKIDKSHGFMQSIIKNQVLRDEYDKEQKVLGTTKNIDESLKNERLSGVVEKEPKRNRTSKREAKQLYVPPHMKKQGALENGEQS